ncbi:hypothetical protein [Flavobacterium pallidum]|uniref:Tetratricopeptide repeat protein n=1 Tax=Flavobacterium pallidum TaxID=2172098 RepID=A0A2S1SFG5_9FLAO|nr:hypothetical protein [Flavobacterium pallidum]AWI25125.1 hypothetical protein HYN49_04020 [Flavobacterium pallidum]
MFKLILLLVSSALFSQTTASPGLDQKDFDGTDCCWRKLSEQKQYKESAALIVAYIEHGNVANIQSLNWHAGQMFAFAGENKQALKYFRKTYNVIQKWFGGEDGKAWFYFAKGTAAFIRRDKVTLARIIGKWKRKLPVDRNLKELEKLLFNWDMQYKEAAGGPP